MNTTASDFKLCVIYVKKHENGLVILNQRQDCANLSLALIISYCIIGMLSLIWRKKYTGLQRAEYGRNARDKPGKQTKKNQNYKQTDTRYIMCGQGVWYLWIKPVLQKLQHYQEYWGIKSIDPAPC